MPYITAEIFVYPDKNIKIHNLKLLDMKPYEENCVAQPNGPSAVNNITINNEYPSVPYFSGDDYFMKSSDDSIPIKKYNNEHKKKEKELIKIREFKCYGKSQHLPNKAICESSLSFLKKKDKKGIWDRKCTYNNECPFYQANKNYKNNFGGCVKGICQMPINMVHLSPHIYSPDFEPYCYNCKDNTNLCCKQQNDKQKYPNLKSPDYAFASDIKQRIKHKKQLSKLGLSYHYTN